MTNPERIKSIACILDDEASLYRAYMPFIKNGGLFIRTNDQYCLGDQVMLSVQLMKEPICYLIEGNVCWITPLGAQENKSAGIGIQFTDEKGLLLCHQIEHYLADKLTSTQLTDTL